MDELDNNNGEMIPCRLLGEYLNSEMDYYEELRGKTTGYNYTSVIGHLDMLIKINQFLKSKGYNIDKGVDKDE